jgi:cholecystokinin A receptor
MRTITNLFLLNLAVSDLLLGVLCIPFTLIGTLLRHFVFGEVMCKLLPFLQGESGKRTRYGDDLAALLLCGAR